MKFETEACKILFVEMLYGVLSSIKQMLYESAFYLRKTCILSYDGLFFAILSWLMRFFLWLNKGVFIATLGVLFSTWPSCDSILILFDNFISHTLECGYRKEGVSGVSMDITISKIWQFSSFRINICTFFLQVIGRNFDAVTKTRTFCRIASVTSSVMNLNLFLLWFSIDSVPTYSLISTSAWACCFHWNFFSFPKWHHRWMKMVARKDSGTLSQCWR